MLNENVNIRPTKWEVMSWNKLLSFIIADCSLQKFQ